MDDATGNAAPDPWRWFGDAVRVFEEWLARRRAGTAESEAALLAAHPELADLLPGMIAAAPSLAKRLDEVARAHAEVAVDAASPRTIGKYEILEPIDTGGMGRVFKARAPGLSRDVALKIPKDVLLGSADLRRFEREAEVGASLDHPHICRVFDYGVDQGVPFIVMPVVSGTSLKAALQDRGSMPLPRDERSIHQVARFVEQLATAIHYAHERGFVHRDLKPGNVMVTLAGEPVVLDLGLVRVVDGGETLSGELLGTPAYMSPEQVSGKRVSGAADVWALGAILYECLANEAAFSGASPAEIHRKILQEEPRPLQRLNPSVPTDLRLIVATALQKRPEDRYATAQALAEDLRCLRERRPIRARPAGLLRAGWRRCQRHPAVASLLAALLLALIAVGLGSYGAVQAAERADRTAEVASREAVRANRAEAEATRRFGDELFRGGLWAGAIDAYDRALQIGAADEVAILIRKAEALEGLLRFADSRALVEVLAARDDLGEHRGKVLLLRGDRSREPESKFLPDRNIDRQLLQAALDAGLEPPDAAYARALLAEDVGEARRLIEEALAARPWHRPANEMYLSTLLLTGDVAAARIAAGTYQGLFPSDDFGVLLETVAIAAAGDFEQAKERIGNHDPDADDEPDARSVVSIVAALHAFRKVPGMVTETVACQALGEPAPRSRQLALVMELTAAGLASGQAVGAVMEPFPRVHPSVLKCWYQIFATVVRLFVALDPEGVEGWAAPILDRMPEGMVFYIRGFARLVRRDHPGASDDFFEAAERGSMIGPRQSALVLGFVATGRMTAAQRDDRSVDRVARAEASLQDILALPDLSDREYRLMRDAASAFLPPERAQEIELARRRRHPE